MSKTISLAAKAAKDGLSSTLQYYHPEESILLENGEVLFEPRIAYQTFGERNADDSNIIWVFHALTANSNPLEWWPGLIGEDEVINPKEHYIICANVIGSPYGSSYPLDFNPVDGNRYLRNFPNISIKDMVKAHDLLRVHLNINSIEVGIGGSMGGQQLLEWATQQPTLFKSIIPIATAAESSPWGIAFRTAQRMAIEADPSFYSNSPKGGWKGLEAARAMALMSYRTQACFNQNQKGKNLESEQFRADSYQRYQGEKLRKRFDAHSYYTLNQAMDNYKVGSNEEIIEEALSKIKSKTLVLGIEEDLLFTQQEQKTIATHIPNAQLELIPSKYGHDGFLLEAKTISNHIKAFLS